MFFHLLYATVNGLLKLESVWKYAVVSPNFGIGERSQVVWTQEDVVHLFRR